MSNQISGVNKASTVSSGNSEITGIGVRDINQRNYAAAVKLLKKAFGEDYVNKFAEIPQEISTEFAYLEQGIDKDTEVSSTDDSLKLLIKLLKPDAVQDNLPEDSPRGTGDSGGGNQGAAAQLMISDAVVLGILEGENQGRLDQAINEIRDTIGIDLNSQRLDEQLVSTNLAEYSQLITPMLELLEGVNTTGLGEITSTEDIYQQIQLLLSQIDSTELETEQRPAREREREPEGPDNDGGTAATQTLEIERPAGRTITEPAAIDAVRLGAEQAASAEAVESVAETDEPVVVEETTEELRVEDPAAKTEEISSNIVTEGFINAHEQKVENAKAALQALGLTDDKKTAELLSNIKVDFVMPDGQEVYYFADYLLQTIASEYKAGDELEFSREKTLAKIDDMLAAIQQAAPNLIAEDKSREAYTGKLTSIQAMITGSKIPDLTDAEVQQIILVKGPDLRQLQELLGKISSMQVPSVDFDPAEQEVKYSDLEKVAAQLVNINASLAAAKEATGAKAEEVSVTGDVNELLAKFQ